MAPCPTRWGGMRALTSFCLVAAALVFVRHRQHRSPTRKAKKSGRPCHDCEGYPCDGAGCGSACVFRPDRLFQVRGTRRQPDCGRTRLLPLHEERRDAARRRCGRRCFVVRKACGLLVTLTALPGRVHGRERRSSRATSELAAPRRWRPSSSADRGDAEGERTPPSSYQGDEAARAPPGGATSALDGITCCSRCCAILVTGLMASSTPAERATQRTGGLDLPHEEKP